ncbi:hypothetical protein SAMN02745866_04179 [Alteromonadaceae bacterium Bs31]|nr:hypothetical protein SAMN02745866_04179 [Alteromonadaceae bacterium Bs31]
MAANFLVALANNRRIQKVVTKRSTMDTEKIVNKTEFLRFYVSIFLSHSHRFAWVKQRRRP